MTNLFGTSIVSLFLVSFVFAPSNARSINEAKNDVIDNICEKTSNQSYCSGVLNSAGTTDLKDLAQYTINLSNTVSKEAFDQAQSLLQNATDPKLKKSYQSCVVNFDFAIIDLQEGEESLDSGDYLGVTVAASSAMTEADMCSEELQKTAQSSPLFQNIMAVDDTCSIIEIIGNFLRGST